LLNDFGDSTSLILVDLEHFLLDHHAVSAKARG